MQNPTVAIIIATRDRADKLSKCIDSILTQTYQRFEIIVVDNGSIDKTPNLLQELKDKYRDKIKHILYTETHTPSKIRNHGLKFLSKSIKYVKWLDDDDLFENRFALSVLVKAMMKNSAFVYGVCRYINHYGETIQYSSFSYIPIQSILTKGSFPCSSVLYNKDIFTVIPGMPENLESSEDIYLALEVIEYAKKVGMTIGFTNKIITVRKRNKSGVFFRNYFNGVKDKAMQDLRKRFANTAFPFIPNVVAFYILEAQTFFRKKYCLLLDTFGHTTEHIYIKKEYYFEPKVTVIS